MGRKSSEVYQKGRVIAMNAFIRYAQSLFSKMKWKTHNCRFAQKAFISKDCVFEGSNFLDKGASVISSRLGYASYVGHDSKITRCNVGKYCCIGPNVRIVHGNHPIRDFVSIHPAFYSTKKQAGFTYVDRQKFEEETYAEKNYYVSIGNDVWIGDGACILAGVSIGDGAVIAANSVVTKNVEAYTIVAGVPATIIRKRFSEGQISFLHSLNWWDRDQKWVQSHAEFFEDIKLLMRIEAEETFS